MQHRPNLIALGIGLAVIVGAAFLPIDDTAVRRHTLERLSRKALATEGIGAADKPRRPVRVQIEGTDADRAVLGAAIDAPTAQVDVGWVPMFSRTEAADAPLLIIASRQDGDRLMVEGALGETAFAQSARLGDWRSLLPPLVALVLAIALRRVVLALFGAVFVGATLLNGANPLLAAWIELRSLAGAVLGAVGVDAVPVDGYFGNVVADTFNLQILGFTFALVGLVAVVGRMGGTKGLVAALSRFARGPRSVQTVTAAMGTAVFFDDYANTVVIGTTARSLTDRFRISREKLAYIVDSTSAPVAGIAIISTWIGYEVGLFEDLLGTLAGVPDVPGSGYELFFAVLPLRFYCLFALALVFIGAIMGRDLGPMYRAERRARSGGPLSLDPRGSEPEALEKPGIEPKARNAVVPIGAVLVSALTWILMVGTAPMEAFSPFSLSDWKSVFDTAGGDIAFILLGSSLIGSGVAFAMAVGQRLLSPGEALGAYAGGIRTLLEAAAILICAWAIKSVCDDLGTGMAIVALIGDALPAVLVPFGVFILSGAVAFSTGTSWGTMALVLPIAAPLSVALSGEPLIVLASLGAVLDGAIWGDHCSPISDTTVLSSTASGCPHLDHVRTQLPYATLAMLAAGLAGYIGAAIGLPLLLSYGGGLILMIAVMWLLGRDPNVPEPAADPSS